jgi:nucleoid DNA-binding protein
MGNRSRWALAGLLAALVLTLSWTARAQPPAKKDALPPLPKALAKETKQKPAVVDALLKALGPALRERLVAGSQVELAGVGVFRVVRVPEHNDLIAGRTVLVPARNFVEFLPQADVAAAVNLPGVVPARVASIGEYAINPTATPGLRTGTTRTRGARSGGP